MFFGTGKTFGVPIINHQAIGTMLADMAIGVECSRYGSFNPLIAYSWCVTLNVVSSAWELSDFLQERRVARFARQGSQRPADDLPRLGREGVCLPDGGLERGQVCADLWRRGESP